MVLFIAVVVLWLCTSFAGLVIKKHNVFMAFSDLNILLKKRYNLVSGILNETRNYTEEEFYRTAEIAKFLEQLRSLPSDFKNIDRIIALNLIVTEEIQQIIAKVAGSSQIQPDSAISAAIQDYCEYENKIAPKQLVYNSAANRLKTVVEIFPSSFFARLIDIKTVDFFKIKD